MADFKEYVLEFIDSGSPILAPLFEVITPAEAKEYVNNTWDTI